MSKDSDDSPPPSASARRRAAARAVPRSLVQIPESEAAGNAQEQASEIPYSVGLGQARPGTSVGFEIQQGELIFPWMALRMVQRCGNQMLIMVGDWRFSLEYDESKASKAGWKFIELLDSVMDQNVRWIRHRPDAGLTVFGVQEEEAEGPS